MTAPFESLIRLKNELDEPVEFSGRTLQVDSVWRARAKGEDVWTAWKQALAELWGPILASMLIVTSGFALFLLSSSRPRAGWAS